jgi:hypothetical protein
MLPASEARPDTEFFGASLIMVQGDASEYLDAIEVLGPDNSPLSENTKISYYADDRIVLDFDLSETPEKMIVLHPRPEGSYVFHIEWGYETSVSIMDSGPHMDLRNWKHHLSEWQELEEVGLNSFVCPEVASSEFPDVSNTAIVEAVREETGDWAQRGYDPGDRWIRLAEQCASPNEYPCGVSISRISLKISVDGSGRRKEILNVDFLIPMGC